MSQNKLTTLQRLRLAAQGLNPRGQDYETPEPVSVSVLWTELKSECLENNLHSPPHEHCLLSASASLSGDEKGLEELGKELPATLFALMYGYNALMGSDGSQGEPATSQVTPARPGIENEFSTNFEFVLNDDPVEARKSVRKHVMQEYRRREQWEKRESIGKRKMNAGLSFGKGRQLPSPSSAKDMDPCEGWNVLDDISTPGVATREPSGPGSSLVVGKRRWLGLSPCKQVARTELSKDFRQNELGSVAAADVDPFRKINFGAEPAMKALLHQYVWNGPRAFDLWAAGTDFHRIAWLYSDIAAYDPEPIPPPLAFEHRSKALQTINKRLQDPQKAGSDANIGAVINLAGHEYVLGSPSIFATHMAGLACMIKSRGGIKWFDGHPELRSIIMRLDLMRAYATVSRHRFPLFKVCHGLPSLGKQLELDPGSDDNMENLTGSRFEEAYDFCRDCIALCDGVEDVASLIRTSKPMQEQTEICCFKQLLEGVVRRLLRGEPGVATNESSGLVKGCCRLAVLIMVDTMIREAFGSPNYNGHNAQAIKANLLNMDTKLGRALYWLMVAMLHGQRVDLGKPARALYLAEAVLLAIDVTDNEWRLTRTRLVQYLDMKQTTDLGDTRISDLWEVGPISHTVMDNWI